MPTFLFLTEPTDIYIDDIIALYCLPGWWGASGNVAPDRSLVRGIVGGSHCFMIATAVSNAPSGRASVIGMGRSISDGASDAYIQDVVVAPDWRGRGVASEIVARIVRRLQGDGIEWIGLVAEQNTQKLYQPLGFEPMADAVPMLYRKK
jgi:ribosomal protein S18 acetylase RimI-like enzyme